MTNRTIAAELCLSRHTVDAHLKHVYLKLDIHSRVELTVLAVQHRLYVSWPFSHAAASDRDTWLSPWSREPLGFPDQGLVSSA
jgi:hypothetical protein